MESLSDCLNSIYEYNTTNKIICVNSRSINYEINTKNKYLNQGKSKIPGINIDFFYPLFKSFLIPGLV